MMPEISLSEANASRLKDTSIGLPKAHSLKDILKTHGQDQGGLSRRDALLGSLSQLSQLTPPAQDAEDGAELAEIISKDLERCWDAQNNDGGTDSEALTVEAALACLSTLKSAFDIPLKNHILAPITAYTGSETLLQIRDMASSLLTSIPEDDLRDLVVHDILQNRLRPAFSKSTTKVTYSGRPNRFPEQGSRPTYTMEAPAWKKQQPQILSAFRWAVETSSIDIVRHHWPLFTPVLLAISEDDDVTIRTTGLDILTTFLDKCPGKILQSTGIGQVFQDAIFPSLMFLPSLTPEDESIRLLQPAYRALVSLAEKEPDVNNLRRRKLLDKVVRDGILAGYNYASQYISVVETLMRSLTMVLDCLDIYAIKHLNSILDMLSSVMTDPFAVSCPSVVVEATIALQTMMLKCWPRIGDQGYGGEVARIIATCWLNVQDGEGISADSMTRLNQELEKSAKLMTTIYEAREDRESTLPLDKILDAEPKLRQLFRV